jgi:prolyl-tRNA synthetase
VVTIEALSKAPYSVPARRQIKTLVYIADSKPIIMLIRGDDSVERGQVDGQDRRGRRCGRPRRKRSWPLLGAQPGSLGRGGVERSPPTVKVYADERPARARTA